MARIGVAALLVLAGLAAAAVPAAAQPASDVRVRDLVVPDRPIAPDLEVAPLSFSVDVGCSLVLGSAAPGSTASTLLVNVQAPSFVAVTGPTSFVVEAAPCLAGAPYASVDAAYQVAVTREAPGLQTIQLALRLSVPSSNPLFPPPEDATLTVLVQAAPYLRIDAQATQKLFQVRGGVQEFTVLLTNHGNVRTQVNAELGAEGSAGRVIPPAPVLLDSPPEAEAQEVRVVFQEPRGRWSQASVSLVFTPTVAPEPGWPPGDPVTVNVLLANGDPVERGVPGVDAPAAFAVLAAAAVALRRRA